MNFNPDYTAGLLINSWAHGFGWSIIDQVATGDESGNPEPDGSKSDMADVSIQVIQGLEAGAVFRNLPTPITIGREEENHVQLNDERISRFHAKIQSQDHRLILTDLESTNGTRVNGQFTRLRTIEVGDQIAVGRCLLVIGSPEQIEKLGRKVRLPAMNDGMGTEEDLQVDAFPFGVPNVPGDLTARQAAEVATLVEYLRAEVLATLNQISDQPQLTSDHVLLSKEAWHRLQMFPPQLSQYIRQLTNPSSDD